MSLDELVNETTAAAALGVSRRTLSNWRWKQEGPKYRKLGQRVVRYARSDLERFIEAGARGTQDGGQ